ncbi:ATP-binding cassette subfamily B protein [Ruminiclostridium sufflavum DSM 19573]|uniref:ATP-binding cassette subfamily B protein n=1 Tax=Ruminiclostridium sufflavum DSM 19573 TaxID=1121337 RepID=A0A318XI33_9FIRM|nr:ABC transporter ATP-binding protein [Ruminiclostridium sufflavum]PYG84366.1 ATP-binding cassette subfamily B protein [Ruminiclostridium sufflavum DSM 19573]
MKILKNEDKLILKIVLLYRPYIKRISIILVCILFSSGISMLIPQISKNMMDNGFITGDTAVVIRLSALALALVIIDQALGILETVNQAYLNSIIPYNLSKKAFKHIMGLRIQYFNNVGITELMSNINTDVANIAKITDQSTFYIITSIFKIFGGLIGLLLIDCKLTLMVILILPLRYFIVKYLAKLRKKSIEDFMKANEEYSAWFGDTLGGIREIKLWSLKRVKCGEFIKKQRSMIKCNIKLNIVDKANILSESIMFQIIFSALYIAGAYMISEKSFTVGGMFAFVTYSANVMSPISAILNIGYSFSGILPSAERLFNFFDLEKEGGIAVKLPRSKEIKGSIRFENVSFCYKKREQVLKNISFEIKQGEKVAIIGANGSGKSTLINILLRFYQPGEGEVFIDNENINRINLEDYRSLISVVSQDNYLFNASVEDNVFLPNKVSKIKALDIATKKKIDSFISKLPDGYKSEVGKNGSKLSGGQRQKIVLSRAMAKNAKIIIMDEGTSFLDYESEEQINRFISDECRDKTVIAVTHKYDILKKMDCVLLLDRGRLNDSGTHDELLLRNELYREAILSSASSSSKKLQA